MTRVRLLENYGGGLKYGLESRLNSAERFVRSLTVQFKEQTKILESAPV